MSLTLLKLSAAIVTVSFCFITLAGGRALTDGNERISGPHPIPPLPPAPFGPSNARTEDGNLIPVEHFFPAARCATCHADTHAAWSDSLHRNAAREPFYRESADILLKTRGIEFTRHCESCHTPVALFAGELSSEKGHSAAPFTELDHEGVTCSVCHSITEARLDGTGSFTIRRPALLAREDSSPIFDEITNEQILADIPGHKRAVMRPLLRQPEFCATCHKVDAPPALNGYKHIRGFSAYDEWQQSGASHEAVAPFYQRQQRTDCRACHMPKVESLNDRAAKNGVIASHRWLGANTAAPLFYGQTRQAELTEQFLKTNVLSLDIFAVSLSASEKVVAPLDAAGGCAVALKPGEEISVELVVSNRNAAHSFPPEVRDLYETWVEFEVADAAGEPVFHSGYLKADGMLDESAHVYKTIILDDQSRHITRHQIWRTTVKAYDNTILPGRSDVVRYRFRAPETDQGDKVGLTLRACVNYRRVNQEYASYVLKRQQRDLTIPIVRMVEAEVRIGGSNASTEQEPAAAVVARRWNDYGIGLLEQAQYGAASQAFRRASELVPGDPNYLTSAALAEMRTERFGPEREQWRKAATLLDAALKLDPANARTRFYKALVLRGDGKLQEAAEELARLTNSNPRDREVRRHMGQTLFSLGRLADARTEFLALLRIDPTDAGAYQFLSPIYASDGNKTEADRTHGLFLQWRDDPLADGVAARFYSAHPEWRDERTWSHTHGTGGAGRPVLTGTQASPERVAQ